MKIPGLAEKHPMSFSMSTALTLFVLISIPAYSEGLHFLGPSWEKWVVGNDTKTKGYAIMELIPEGEKIENWTQLVTIQNFAKKGFSAPEEAMNAAKQKMTERCPSVVWSVIERIREDIIYEWRIENCPSGMYYA